MDTANTTEAMRDRVRSLRDTILRRMPDSDLSPVTAATLDELRRDYPTIPDHLLIFFEEFGAGCIGDSSYMLYALIDPAEVYDEATAAELQGIVLIGDDFAGTNEGYDTRLAVWRFGSIDHTGRFQPNKEDETIISFLEGWLVKPG